MSDRDVELTFASDFIPTETERMEDLLNGVYQGDITSIRRAGHLAERGADAVPELMVCLNDRHWKVRFEAVRALGRIGKKAEAAVPKLVKLKEDPNPRVCNAVDEALASIQKKAA